eukprot:TRINITY_DN75251_c0_g1_i1.p1 TRINITY_DN75251_c0_g1~~TRINITY_DN75251_c0_g1_i1.p1  ORF type:complete len:418 (+),score=80.10 TRINITY_DN75251_c0_g1_i1:220-1473(+)
MPNVAHQSRCLPSWYGRQHKDSPEEVVRKLTHDVELLTLTEGGYVGGTLEEKKQSKKRELCEDVHKQLHCILNFIKDLTEEHAVADGNAREVTREQIESLEQFIKADLPVQLLTQLASLEFETRKDVMNVFSALLWPGLPKEVGQQILQYFRFHPLLFGTLMSGYAQEEIALHCGVVLRSLLRQGELVDLFLSSGQVFGLLGFTRHQSIDIAADAMYSLRTALLDHKEIAGPWLTAHCDEFFALYNPLLQCDDYVVERQAITLLSGILLEPSFRGAMMSYVSKTQYLQVVMNLLRDHSSTIQCEAFHVFKIFVVNPKKPAGVQQILFKNRDRLVVLLQSLHAVRSDDKSFAQDQQKVIARLLELTLPPKGQTSPAAQGPAAVPPSIPVMTTCAEQACADHAGVKAGLPIQSGHLVQL